MFSSGASVEIDSRAYHSSRTARFITGAPPLAAKGAAKSDDDARRIAESFDFSGAFALAPNEPWLHPTSLNSPGDGHEPLSSVPSVTQVCAHHEPGIFVCLKLLLIHTADHSS